MNRFLFSANKESHILKLVRLHLVGIKQTNALYKIGSCPINQVTSIVFDEIDTGVSGETAFKIGKVMQDMASKHQLIAITHLPQIASRGGLISLFIRMLPERKPLHVKAEFR